MFASQKTSQEVMEKSVFTTGVPLSERFKNVPSHNPLRPSPVVTRLVPDVDFQDVSTSNAGIRRNPIHSEQSPVIVTEANELAVVKATKEAEILRLRAEIQSMEHEVGRADKGHGRGNPINPLKRIIGKPSIRNRLGSFSVKRREGGGVVVAPNGGHRLNLQSSSALSVLGVEKVRRNPRSPLKGRASSPIRGPGRARSPQKGPGRARGRKNRNFPGPSKSKADLDAELDNYMKQCKAKNKTDLDLDKELDEYMMAARSQSSASTTGFISFTPTTPPPDSNDVDSDDERMVIVE